MALLVAPLLLTMRILQRKMNKSKIFHQLVSRVENVRELPPHSALLKRANNQKLRKGKALFLSLIHIFPILMKTIRNIPQQARITHLYLPHLQASRQHNLILKMLVITNKILYFFFFYLHIYIYIFFFISITFLFFFILFYFYFIFYFIRFYIFYFLFFFIL